MKRMLCAFLAAVSLLAAPLTALAQQEEPVIYIIKRGDTLWGLSDRFLKDPFYWPDLWARNPRITNPHLIYPGQKVRIYADRIEIEEAPGATAKTPVAEEVTPERTFQVTGGEGFLLETELKPSGYIIATSEDRQIMGTDDIVYTDIGKNSGSRTGDRFSIFKELEVVKHPVTNCRIGHRVASLGTLQLVKLENKNSKARITQSYREIGPGAYLMPYREKRREIPLRAAWKNLHGYIVTTREGNINTGAGDVVYLDLGRAHGVVVGNMAYIVRDRHPETLLAENEVGALPKDVIGALVIVETGPKTSAGLIIKSTETIFPGDQIELANH